MILKQISLNRQECHFLKTVFYSLYIPFYLALEDRWYTGISVCLILFEFRNSPNSSLVNQVSQSLTNFMSNPNVAKIGHNNITVDLLSIF